MDELVTINLVLHHEQAGGSGGGWRGDDVEATEGGSHVG